MTWEQISHSENLSITSLLDANVSSRGSSATNSRFAIQEKDRLILKLKACVRHLDALVATLERERDDKSAEVDQARSCRQSELQEALDAKAFAEKELERARSAQQDAESRLQSAEERERQLELKRQQLESSLSASEEREQVGKSHNEELQGERDSLRDMLQSEKASNQSMQEYNSTLQEFVSSLKSNLSEVSDQIEGLKGERNELQEHVSSLKVQKESLTEQLEQAKSAADEKERARQDATEESSRLQAELSHMTTERDTQQTEAKRLQASLNETQQNADDARRQADDARAQINAVEEKQNELEKARVQATAERDDWHYKLTQKEEELDSYKDAMKRREEKLQSLSEQYGTLEQQNDSKNELIQELRGELAQVQARATSAENLTTQRGGQAAELRAENERLQSELSEAERQLREGEELRRKMHNRIQELRGNIRVYCRVRPPTDNDVREQNGFSLTYPSNNERKGCGIDVKRPNAREANTFTLDRVFDEKASNDQVYNDVSELVQSVLDGYKVCIFAYGQTGSGKTYTMVGNGDDVYGIIPRAINQMFRTKENRESHLSFSMQASLFEIYNEEMRDLLAKGKPKRNGASELQETELDSQSQAEELIDSASTNRSVSYTAQNEQSSRSHMIFRLRVKCHNVDTGETLEGGLDLVDLAGSEKLKKSGSEGESKREAEKIHTSLTALSRVLQSLANNESHIPYRDSKLTQELMPSLGGQSSKTLMMVNVSSDPQSSEETVSSLRLGERANGAVVDSTKRKTAQQQHQQQQSLTKRGR